MQKKTRNSKAKATLEFFLQSCNAIWIALHAPEEFLSVAARFFLQFLCNAIIFLQKKLQECCNKIDQIYFVTALLQSFLQEKGNFSSNFEHKKECLYCELSSGEKKSVMQSLILVSCFCRSGDIRPTKYKN